MIKNIDINETEVLKHYPEAMELFLKDHITQQNFCWVSDLYSDRGEGFQYKDAILIDSITGDNEMIMRPRSVKTKDEQTQRSKDMVESFTPSWEGYTQNNLIDNVWFGRQVFFNEEAPGHAWKETTEKIEFLEVKTWKDYVRDTRLRIICGEAPCLVIRYSIVIGMPILLPERNNLLARKLRVVSEITETSCKIFDWYQEACMNIYGYEWQADNLLLAKEALLFTFLYYYSAKFGDEPLPKFIQRIAYIISRTIRQMDKLKFCPPGEESFVPQIHMVLFSDPVEPNLYLIRDRSKPLEKQKIYFKSIFKPMD